MADSLKEICEISGWTYCIDAIGTVSKSFPSYIYYRKKYHA